MRKYFAAVFEGMLSVEVWASVRRMRTDLLFRDPKWLKRAITKGVAEKSNHQRRDMTFDELFVERLV